MKTRLQILIWIVFLIVVGQIHAQPPAKTNDMSIGEAINAFAVEAYGQFAGREGNIVFSPSSIHTALAMTYAGARNETAKQMTDVMHYGRGEDYFKRYGAFLKETRPGRGAKHRLYIANALWPEKKYHFLKEFIDINKQYFGTSLKPMDYENNFENARKEINQWVERKTKKRIKDLLPEDSLCSLTRLVLTNAIYFKGDWARPFRKESTYDAPFTLLDGRERNVPTMHQTGHFAYGETDGLQLLKLPYKGNDLSMVILLPKKKDGLPNVEKKLTPANLAAWLCNINKSREVRVSFPKFRIDFTPQLVEALKALGMTDAFDETGKADFSGMDGTKWLYISGIFHKAFIQVDEKGTEAAAATAVVTKARAAMPSRMTVFNADHPFLFLLRHEKTGAILFLGRVVEP